MIFPPASSSMNTTSSTSPASSSAQDRSLKRSFDTTEMGASDDMAEMFDFDGFDSSHSPLTLSPNHTPSPPPHTGASPFALSPSFDFSSLDPNAPNALDFSFDYPMFEKPQPVPDIYIKQEPVEFGFPPPSAPNPESDLPPDQAAALQQLLANMMNYQTQYGLENSMAMGGLNATAGPSTIEPAMLFGGTPGTASSLVSPSISLPSLVHDPSPAAQPIPRRESVEPHSDDELLSISPIENKPDSNVNLDEALANLVPLPDIFSAGRGKGGKKGGGLSSVVRGDDEDLDDDDSWRPSPEEYKKLNSKEKRQLRNKLSARAFRTRRKDYIGTLESHIKDRDDVIGAIKSELTNSRSENLDLRRELAALKASTMEVLHPETANVQSVSPALITALAMTPSSFAKPEIKRTSTPITINTRKDIPASPASRGFWGGNNDPMSGGPTICHTMFTPDLVLPSTQSYNLNPRLNDAQPTTSSNLGASANNRDLTDEFSEWSETNPFSLRSMDSYRIQMWSRLAREAAAEKAGVQHELRPKFYAEPMPTASPSSSTPTPAQLANTATNHITSKLATSFWSAFSSSGQDDQLDTDKLTAVVLGTSRLRVVEKEEDDLVGLLSGLKLQSGLGMGGFGGLGSSLKVRENPLGVLAGFFVHGYPTRA